MNDHPDGVTLQVTLSPGLSDVLRRLADQEGMSVPTFIAVLLNEALGHRLLLRPFRGPDKPSD
jgi:hypothetical protein